MLPENSFKKNKLTVHIPNGILDTCSIHGFRGHLGRQASHCYGCDRREAVISGGEQMKQDRGGGTGQRCPGEFQGQSEEPKTSIGMSEDHRGKERGFLFDK